MHSQERVTFACGCHEFNMWLLPVIVGSSVHSQESASRKSIPRTLLCSSPCAGLRFATCPLHCACLAQPARVWEYLPVFLHSLCHGNLSLGCNAPGAWALCLPSNTPLPNLLASHCALNLGLLVASAAHLPPRGLQTKMQLHL